MPSLPRFALVGASALALAGCMNDQNATSLTPTSASYGKTPAPPTCSASTLNGDARNYFASNKDTVYTLIKAVDAAYTTGGAVAATDASFDVLERISIALIHTGVITGTPAAGNKLVTDLMLCMSVGTLPTGFSVTKALEPSGLFAVRGGSDDATGAATSRLAPVYGAEAQATSSWSASAKQRFLMYGYRIGYGFSLETPAADSAFELSTVPTPITFSPAIAAGVCSTNESAINPRFQHVGVILALQTLGFCGTSSSLAPEGTGFFAFAKRVGGWFAPKPLYAFFARDAGGLISGLSPGGAVVFTATDATLSFVNQIPDAKVSTVVNQFVPEIQVQAKTAKGTALGGVTVTLRVAGNNGSYAPPSDSVEVTDASGVAHFKTFYLNKAGGYTITATGNVLNSATKSVISNLFHIKNQ